MGGLKKCVVESQRKKAANRPAKEIDWKLVDEFLMCGSPGTEIAALFDMCKDTFYRRFEDHYKISFTFYCQEKRSKGEALLRRQQYLKAIGKSTDGDNTMLVWLGKNRLGQSESPTQEAVEDIRNKFEQVMAQITKFQLGDKEYHSADSSLNIAESHSNSDA